MVGSTLVIATAWDDEGNIVPVLHQIWEDKSVIFSLPEPVRQRLSYKDGGVTIQWQVVVGS